MTNPSSNPHHSPKPTHLLTRRHFLKPRPEAEQLPRLGNFQAQWFNACKGNLKTACDFSCSGTTIEQLLLGLVAFRVGNKLEYDGKAGRVTHSAEANALLTRKYREGWTLNGQPVQGLTGRMSQVPRYPRAT